MSGYDWMEEAREIAAQIWCDDRVSNRVMDVEFAEVIAERIAAWMQTAAQNDRNTEYYRGLLVRIGESIGEHAYIADDGSRSDDVLCAKLPELVEAWNQRQPHPDSEAIEESLRFWIATRINKASVSMASSGYENHDLVKAFDSVYESIQQAMEQEK